MTKDLNKELNTLAIENDILRSHNKRLIEKLSKLENKKLTEQYLYNDIIIERILYL